MKKDISERKVELSGISSKESRLERLKEKALKEIEYLSFPQREWRKLCRTKKGEVIYDVLIIGAGQCGIAIAQKLYREGIKNVVVVDQKCKGEEGPWRSFARMKKLRTDKRIPGVDGGVPSLTLRSYFEALHGEEAWSNLDYMATLEWHNYLNWLSSIIPINIKSEHNVSNIKFLKD